MLLTDDGQLAHRLLSPKHHVSKAYAFTSKFPISDEDVAHLSAGVEIETKDGGSYMTKPAEVRLSLPSRTEGVIVLTEGKYHQIKFMLMAVHNQITSLHRVTFGPLKLDPALAAKEWRLLKDEEIEEIRKAAE